MVGTLKYLKFGARVVPTSMGRVYARFVAFRRSAEGFTLIELLDVMAMIGILAGVTAGAVTGLGGQGINAQIFSDASAMETAADRLRLGDAAPPGLGLGGEDRECHEHDAEDPPGSPRPLRRGQPRPG